MALTFYYGSGSPFAWRVWLALEHKRIPYELHRISFDKGEHKAPEFLAINPRGKVPAIVEDGFALWESSAIVEYLEDRYPEWPVLPAEPRARAVARRVANEVDNYVYPALRRLLAQTLFRPKGDGDPQEIAAALAELAAELARFEASLTGDHLAGPLSIADYALYPMLRLLRRLDERTPALDAGRVIGPRLAAWMARLEALPYMERTFPPHWRA